MTLDERYSARAAELGRIEVQLEVLRDRREGVIAEMRTLMAIANDAASARKAQHVAGPASVDTPPDDAT